MGERGTLQSAQAFGFHIGAIPEFIGVSLDKGNTLHCAWTIHPVSLLLATEHASR